MSVSIREETPQNPKTKIDKKCELHPTTRASLCIPCKGSQICDHSLVRYLCIDCNPDNFCIHKTRKTICIPCGGTSVCIIHQCLKARCKKCGGSQICDHGCRKYQCNTCGTAYCIHECLKYTCKKCEGAGICIHKNIRSICKECQGSALCIHLVSKYTCRKCEGSGICEHKTRRVICKTCKGGSICKHEIRKSRCKECDGSALCKSDWCDSIKHKSRDGYCHYCFVHLYPDHELSKNFKTKEKTVIDFVKENYPEVIWISDKIIEGGCSKRRPDLLCDLGDYILIIEVDENQHRRYDCSCEHKRLMEISLDLGHRPIVFIRFNPDDYIDKEQKKVKSCWSISKTGVLSINSKKHWNERLEALKIQVDYWMKHKSEKTLEIVELFYDQFFKDEEED
jgi:hypothetical protein